MKHVVGAILILTAATLPAAEPAGSFLFEFGSGKIPPGAIAITPTNVYDASAGYGYDLGFGPSTNAPYFFSVKVPEGNHRVTVTFGDDKAVTTNTVKAEARRLMVEHLVTSPGESITRSFNVHTRTVEIPGGMAVRLKAREKTNEVVTWDDKLTLEFNGPRPGIRALEIAPAPTNVVTVFITGDSTVCDQPLEPWNSWGQMLPRFFNGQVSVANYAESGESIKSSLRAHRFAKVYATIRPGDYLFVQFGHNDMKDKATNALQFYEKNLRQIVTEARKRGATPVLITSMERKGSTNGPTLKEYPATVRAVAKAERVALIDLNEMSLKFYHALGTNLDAAFQDGTHHNNYGSYEFARMVVEGIRSAKLPLAAFLSSDAQPFDPAQPDDFKTFKLPESPLRDASKPDGS